VDLAITASEPTGLKTGPKPAFLKNQVAQYLLAPGNSG
jgi:hypothetical protein